MQLAYVRSGLFDALTCLTFPSRPEPNILLFRRPMGTDPVTGAVDPARLRMAEAAFRQQLMNQNRS
ncbi:unnamed protein product [Ectocarpus sp. CCAP 1310/34]|nr:unnamed protein product [Ectocarpus sp. CCAP 1310/34]